MALSFRDTGKSGLRLLCLVVPTALILISIVVFYIFPLFDQSLRESAYIFGNNFVLTTTPPSRSNENDVAHQNGLALAHVEASTRIEKEITGIDNRNASTAAASSSKLSRRRRTDEDQQYHSVPPKLESSTSSKRKKNTAPGKLNTNGAFDDLIGIRSKHKRWHRRRPDVKQQQRHRQTPAVSAIVRDAKFSLYEALYSPTSLALDARAQSSALNLHSSPHIVEVPFSEHGALFSAKCCDSETSLLLTTPTPYADNTLTDPIRCCSFYPMSEVMRGVYRFPLDSSSSELHSSHTSSDATPLSKEKEGVEPISDIQQKAFVWRLHAEETVNSSSSDHSSISGSGSNDTGSPMTAPRNMVIRPTFEAKATKASPEEWEESAMREALAKIPKANIEALEGAFRRYRRLTAEDVERGMLRMLREKNRRQKTQHSEEGDVAEDPSSQQQQLRAGQKEVEESSNNSSDQKEDADGISSGTHHDNKKPSSSLRFSPNTITEDKAPIIIPAYGTACVGAADCDDIPAHFLAFANKRIALGYFILVVNSNELPYVAMAKALHRRFPQQFLYLTRRWYRKPTAIGEFDLGAVEEELHYENLAAERKMPETNVKSVEREHRRADSSSSTTHHSPLAHGTNTKSTKTFTLELPSGRTITLPIELDAFSHPVTSEATAGNKHYHQAHAEPKRGVGKKERVSLRDAGSTAHAYPAMGFSQAFNLILRFVFDHTVHTGGTPRRGAHDGDDDPKRKGERGGMLPPPFIMLANADYTMTPYGMERYSEKIYDLLAEASLADEIDEQPMTRFWKHQREVISFSTRPHTSSNQSSQEKQFSPPPPPPPFTSTEDAYCGEDEAAIAPHTGMYFLAQPDAHTSQWVPYRSPQLSHDYYNEYETEAMLSERRKRFTRRHCTGGLRSGPLPSSTRACDNNNNNNNNDTCSTERHRAYYNRQQGQHLSYPRWEEASVPAPSESASSPAARSSASLSAYPQLVFRWETFSLVVYTYWAWKSLGLMHEERFPAYGEDIDIIVTSATNGLWFPEHYNRSNLLEFVPPEMREVLYQEGIDSAEQLSPAQRKHLQDKLFSHYSSKSLRKSSVRKMMELYRRKEHHANRWHMEYHRGIRLLNGCPWGLKQMSAGEIYRSFFLPGARLPFETVRQLSSENLLPECDVSQLNSEGNQQGKGRPVTQHCRVSSALSDVHRLREVKAHSLSDLNSGGKPPSETPPSAFDNNFDSDAVAAAYEYPDVLCAMLASVRAAAGAGGSPIDHWGGGVSAARARAMRLGKNPLSAAAMPMATSSNLTLACDIAYARATLRSLASALAHVPIGRSAHYVDIRERRCLLGAQNGPFDPLARARKCLFDVQLALRHIRTFTDTYSEALEATPHAHLRFGGLGSDTESAARRRLAFSSDIFTIDDSRRRHGDAPPYRQGTDEEGRFL